MTTQQSSLRWAFRLLAVVCATVVLVVPSVSVANADPQGDAQVAIDQAWTTSGGDTSPLGPKVGGVYPAGAGFGQDFVNGAIFFSPDTGARSVFGAILEKYRSLGGPADSGLGFPNIDEGPGRAPESRNVTFNAGDGAVIFWTPPTGAWLVRGIINAAWDRVGGSSGPLGVPVEDETYSGETISQRFTGGQLSYDTAAKTFTTTPPELAGQLADLPLPDDAASSIDLAWRVAGGQGGQLGAKQGDPYPVGDGTGQDFAGGKIFFSPDTGAHVVSGTILEKYEADGGPTGELGFPTANEADGDVPGSRISTFGAADAPAIVWTPEHGAVIVRGPMKAAWDELGGSGGDLGVPIADQTGDETITQNFSGGQVTYNSTNNTFSTQPPELAERLAGLDLPQQGTAAPSAPAAPPAAQADDAEAGDSTGQNWTLWVIIGLVVVAAAAVGAFLFLRQRRDRGPATPADGGYPGFREHDGDSGGDSRGDFDGPGYGTPDDADRSGWPGSASGQSSGPTGFGSGDREGADREDTDYLAAQPPWAKRDSGTAPWSEQSIGEPVGEPVVPTGGLSVTASGPELFTHHGSHEADDFGGAGDLGAGEHSAGDFGAGEHSAADDNADVFIGAEDEELDPDDVDTAPTRVQSDPDEQSGRHAALGADESRPPWLIDDDPAVPGPNSLFAPVYAAAPPPGSEEESRPGDDAYLEESDEYSDLVTDTDDHVAPDYRQSDHAEPDPYAEPVQYSEPVQHSEPEQYAEPEQYREPGHYRQSADQPAPADYAAPEDYSAPSDYSAPTDYSQPTEYPPANYASGADYSEPADYGRSGYSQSEYSPTAYPQPEYSGPGDGTVADSAADTPPPAIHLPLADPDEAPEGYPVKGSMRTGTYHSPGSAAYDVTVAEIWFASEELAESNGFTKAE
ncbi:MAG: hypothetical protein K0R68_1399 [Mycobacterium sp.]|nr:hypothetical protein [Mycobacterium sp.]